MTLLSEDEAKTKWCPLVRLVGFKDSDAEGTSWNRSPDDPTGIKSPSAKCIASACMAWHWHMHANYTIDPSKGDMRSLGWCGAFGRPS